MSEKDGKSLSGEDMSKTSVFFIENSILKDNNNIKFVKLRHPGSGDPALFLFGPDNTVHEIMVFDESKRSWFIDNNVKSDGKLFYTTPVDPIFMAIPYLKKIPKAMPLEQCLYDADYPEIRRLADCRNLKLSLVADRKGDESLRAFKFNEEKTLNWLHKKLKKLVPVIKGKNINVSQATVSANYINSKYKSESETDYLSYAHGIISEYLDEELSKKLAQHLNLPETLESRKRKLSNSIDEGQEKKSKTKENDVAKIADLSPINKSAPKTIKTEATPKQTISKKDQARQKAAMGSKSITSFFKKSS